MLFGKCVNSVYIKESESEVAQSCPTLCDPVDCSLPGSSLHGILQARVLEWGAIAFSRGSSWPRDWTRVSCIPGRCFNLWATREGQFTLRHLPVLALSWLPIVITWRLQVIRFPSHLPNVVTETLFLSNLKMKTLVFECFFFFLLPWVSQCLQKQPFYPLVLASLILLGGCIAAPSCHLPHPWPSSVFSGPTVQGDSLTNCSLL